MALANPQLKEVVHDLAVTDIGNPPDTVNESNPLLTKLVSLGTELWIDTGDLELARSVWKKELSSLTTNNTLANQVVQTGILDEVISKTAAKLKSVAPDLSDQERVLEVGFVINCKIALRLVQAFHQKVSVELHPSVSRDIKKTIYYGHRYFEVCPEFFNVKIPLTPEGYLAVRKLRKDGVPINFTLGFSARQNYLAARLSNPDYVNVFLGRLNQVVSDNGMGTGKWLGEKVTLETQNVLRVLRGQDFSVHTKLIGASIRNGEQVANLGGLDVLTVPPKAMKEFLESNLTPDDVMAELGETLTPEIHSDWMGRFQSLWEVSEKFKVFTDDLLLKKNLDEISGEDLVQLCELDGIDLFYRFSDEEHKRIYDHGKIPNLSDWPDNVAVDDLMTQSALSSFAKDQDALDKRILSFL